MKKLKSQRHKRNSKCPCGSDKKLKNCCLPKIKRAQAGIKAGKSQAQIMNEELFGIQVKTPEENDE